MSGKRNGKQRVFQPRKTAEAPLRLFPPHDRGLNELYCGKLSLFTVSKCGKWGKPRHYAVFPVENYAENRETRFGKMFSSIAETALKKLQKAVMSWAFPRFCQFFKHEFKTCSGLFRKAYKLSCFSVLSPLFSSKSSCFSRFSALVSNHFHRFPHSLNKKWKTRKTWGWWLWKFPPWVERVLKNMTFHL